MKKEIKTTIIFLIIIIILAILVYIFFIKSPYGEHYLTINGCGNIKYKVIDMDGISNNPVDKDSIKAASILCDLNKKTIRLIDHLKAKYGTSDYRVNRLVKEYDEDDLVENLNETFVTGKGRKIYICIRDNNSNFIDINTLMFVLSHELAHVASISYQHTKEFWTNNVFLMKEAASIGILKIIDYQKYPVTYCKGLIINQNPYYVKL